MLNVILDQPSTIHQTFPYTLWSKLDHFTSIKGSSAPWVLYRSNNDILHIGRVRLYSTTQTSERNTIDIFSLIDNIYQLIRNGKLYVTDLKHSPYYTVVNIALSSIRRLPTHHDIKNDGREYINEDWIKACMGSVTDNNRLSLNSLRLNWPFANFPECVAINI